MPEVWRAEVVLEVPEPRVREKGWLADRMYWDLMSGVMLRVPKMRPG